MNRILLITAAASLVLTSGCAPKEETLTVGPISVVDVDMVDNAFKPAQLTVKDGEKVTFVFHNMGTVVHEAVIGDKDAQDGHDHGNNGDDNAVEVAPGETARLSHAFRRGETIEIGCHVPGHYESGMKMTIEVT